MGVGLKNGVIKYSQKGINKTSTFWEVDNDKRLLRNGIVLFQTANF